MSCNTIRSATAAEPLGPYPHARRVGNMLFLSGIGPRLKGSKDIPGAVVDAQGTLLDYDIEAEMRSCFENIRTVLADAGSSWDHIVDVTSFLTDMKRDWKTYNRVYAEFFPPGPNQPCRTTVEVSALPTGGNTPIHFEIKVIATVP
ncbi:MAG: RidA family protein [Phycisphaeraceae bacterium]|nr:RidA family protein [Phycisphaeraceae bacterium]MCW5753097.1 RidA family protein [Phycisphaeraceae bacterium]